ncbi:MAG TPA: hypothetical protein VFA10_03295 [Ktedonobacteraceae bacterium]|nr:hypothetical protein [Ktedonobacteraceae bacterium]
MKRRIFHLVLLVTLAFSSVGLAGCSLPFFNASGSSVTAAFRLINLVLNTTDNVFTIAKDSILLADDAIKLINTIKANENPPVNTQTDHIQVSILYNKQGIESQDIYDLTTGKASLGIFLEGGETFESFSASNIDIDATHTHKISIVPLQNGVSNFTVSARRGWQNTGIFLKRGRTFKIKYLSGTWTIAKGVVGTSDAAGEPVNPPSNLVCNCGEPLPGYSTQAMIGRVGAGIGYTPLQVGDNFSGVAYDNAFLYLRINLPDQLLSRSGGVITGSIETHNS